MSHEQPNDNESHTHPTPEEIGQTFDPEFAAKVAEGVSALQEELVSNNRKEPTAAQFKANRENAQKSTGPKSDQGKQRVARNALKHGLTAELEINTRFEFDGEFNLFQQQMRAQLSPASPEEVALVDRITTLHWRLKRVPLMESKYIDKISEDDSALALQNEAKTLSNLSRYEGQLDRCLHRTLKELKETQTARHAFPYQTRTFLFIEESPLSVDDRATGRGLGVGRENCETNPIPETPSSCAHPSNKPQATSHISNGVGDGGSENYETNPIGTPSSCAHPSHKPQATSHISNGAGDGGSAADKTNPILRNPSDPAGSETSNQVTLSPPRERVGPGLTETFQSPQGQGRGEGDPAQLANDKTNPIHSQDSHLAQAHPAPCDPAAGDPADPNAEHQTPNASPPHDSRLTVHDSRSPSDPNAERHTPKAFPPQSSIQEAAYYEAINCAMAMLNISPYDEINIEELEKLIPEHLRRFSPLSVDDCATGRGLGVGRENYETKPISPGTQNLEPSTCDSDETDPDNADPATLSPPRERVGSGIDETVPSPQSQSRGEGDAAQIGALKNCETKPLPPITDPSDRSDPSDPNAPQSSIVNSQSSILPPPNPYVS